MVCVFCSYGDERVSFGSCVVGLLVGDGDDGVVESGNGGGNGKVGGGEGGDGGGGGSDGDFEEECEFGVLLNWE